MEKMMQLCLNQTKINEARWYEQIKIHKLKKQVETTKKELMEEDIFHLSRTFLSIMQHLSINTKMDLEEYDNISLSPNKMLLNVDDTIVDYYPLSNKFKITDGTSTYFIYENTKISRSIYNSWKPIEEKIRVLYIESILKVSEDLNKIPAEIRSD
jgi:hypothetical protein